MCKRSLAGKFMLHSLGDDSRYCQKCLAHSLSFLAKSPSHRAALVCAHSLMGEIISDRPGGQLLWHFLHWKPGGILPLLNTPPRARAAMILGATPFKANEQRKRSLCQHGLKNQIKRSLCQRWLAKTYRAIENPMQFLSCRSARAQERKRFMASQVHSHFLCHVNEFSGHKNVTIHSAHRVAPRVGRQRNRRAADRRWLSALALLGTQMQPDPIGRHDVHVGGRWVCMKLSPLAPH